MKYASNFTTFYVDHHKKKRIYLFIIIYWL